MHKVSNKDKTNNMSGTNAVLVYALSPGQAYDNPIDDNSIQLQNHWTDYTKKLTDNTKDALIISRCFWKG